MRATVGGSSKIILASVNISNLSSECVNSGNNLSHVLLLVQIDRLEEIQFIYSEIFASAQEVADVFHLLESHLTRVALHVVPRQSVDQSKKTREHEN